MYREITGLIYVRNDVPRLSYAENKAAADLPGAVAVEQGKRAFDSGGTL